MKAKALIAVVMLALSTSVSATCLKHNEESDPFAAPGNPEGYRVFFKYAPGQTMRCHVWYFCNTGQVQYGRRCVDVQGNVLATIIGGQLQVNKNRAVSGTIWTDTLGQVHVQHGTECGPGCLSGLLHVEGFQSLFTGGLIVKSRDIDD